MTMFLTQVCEALSKLNVKKTHILKKFVLFIYFIIMTQQETFPTCPLTYFPAIWFFFVNSKMM